MIPDLCQRLVQHRDMLNTRPTLGTGSVEGLASIADLEEAIQALGGDTKPRSPEPEVYDL